MLEAMSSNPETLELLMSNNPFFASADPNTRSQMQRMIPQLARQMNQPGFRNMLTNPRALRLYNSWLANEICGNMRVLCFAPPHCMVRDMRYVIPLWLFAS
ncbi:unnamed protein product [Dibothriocephalus latus]|uniref:STI1 domain-containing protein n=1 Tax=Dibothriocephalus latus TaxID=60516 RepID=A0A3P7MIR8_DIBLA|nr:unnamed protein product [Dibothriocephalus latus]